MNAPTDDGQATRSGRRPGAPPTRARILTEARRLFGERGFERTTIRAIAAAAQVDPALVLHYFINKDELFAATLELPINPAAVIPLALSSGPEGAGERAIRTFLGFWDDPTLRPAFMALVRSATSNERAADAMRGVIMRQVVRPITQYLGMPHAELRAQLVASQLIGLAMARYLLRVEPLASIDTASVVHAVAPNIQRYLTGDLDLADVTADPDGRITAAGHDPATEAAPSPPELT